MRERTRAQHPDWIWPRADSHVVLGVAGSIAAQKTFVEPGGAFSPGVGSFGVSVWVWLDQERRLIAPELLPREAIRDRLLGGLLPIHRSRWRAGPLELDLRLGAEPVPDVHQPNNLLSCRAVNRGEAETTATVLLVVRSPGPAGGPIRSIQYDPEIAGFLIDDTARVLGSRRPSVAGCVSLLNDELDLSVLLRRGELPARAAAFDHDGHCGGCLAYRVTLDPGGEWDTWWDFPIFPGTPAPSPALRERAARPALPRLAALADDWRERLTEVKIELPDARLSEAFHASLTHLVMAFHGDEPRLATVCYPLPWVRGSSYILNALDKAGLIAWSRPAMPRFAESTWAGGFGPEADAPGIALWAMVEHWLLSRDEDWLQSVYPRLRSRVEWLQRMRRTDEPLRVPARNVLPRTRLHPEQNLVCEAASDGLINGRMDWHRPRFWVNAFSLAGLRGAARAAEILGEADDADAWRAEAADLAAALGPLTAELGRNERDMACAIWPTGALAPDDPAVVEAFERWWFMRRYDEKGYYHGEARWRYFELGQAHNLLRLGMRDRTLLTIEQFLRTQDAPGLYAWAEGEATGDPSGDWKLIRGWWPDSKIMPHGWVSAEMVLLIRDLLVHEEDDALVLGAGLRESWLRSEQPLGITGAPTHHGTLDWRLESSGTGRYTVTIRCQPTPPPGGYRLRFPLPASAIVEVDGAAIREVEGDWPLPPTATTASIFLP